MKRYGVHCEPNSVHLIKSKTGELCLWEDVEKLIKENRRLKQVEREYKELKFRMDGLEK
jgi:hypothetical protein